MEISLGPQPKPFACNTEILDKKEIKNGSLDHMIDWFLLRMRLRERQRIRTFHVVVETRRIIPHVFSFGCLNVFLFFFFFEIS